jgi:thiopeptide-type bacteriocin biosynthesis protein
MIKSDMEKQGDKWLSIYIFYDGNADHLLKQFVFPFIQQWSAPWFFIRYWDGGDHIRLRLKAAVSQHDSIVEALGLRRNAFLGSEEVNVKTVRVAEYEPEFERYGNTQSITWAEQHFECSSAYILNWLVKKEASQSAVMQAIKLHLALLFASKWDGERLIGVCNFFLEGWLPKLFNQKDPKEAQKEFWLNQFQSAFEPRKNQLAQSASQFWQALNAGEVDDDLGDYLSVTIKTMCLYQHVDFEQNKMFQVVSSFMHMNNNRLGISNYEEAYIMYCIITCIQYINEDQTHQV